MELPQERCQFFPSMITTLWIRRIIATLLSLVLGLASMPTALAQASTEETLPVSTSDNPTPVQTPVPKPVRTYTMAMTAYTSSVDECDADPFIAADGTTTYDGMVATNILPFGTKVRIPALFGEKVFTVHDRMNARYSARMDVWMYTKTQAKTFGIRRNVKIEVLSFGDGKSLYTKRAEAKRAAALQAKQALAFAK